MADITPSYQLKIDGGGTSALQLALDSNGVLNLDGKKIAGTDFSKPTGTTKYPVHKDASGNLYVDTPFPYNGHTEKYLSGNGTLENIFNSGYDLNGSGDYRAYVKFPGGFLIQWINLHTSTYDYIWDFLIPFNSDQYAVYPSTYLNWWGQTDATMEKYKDKVRYYSNYYGKTVTIRSMIAIGFTDESA